MTGKKRLGFLVWLIILLMVSSVYSLVEVGPVISCYEEGGMCIYCEGSGNCPKNSKVSLTLSGTDWTGTCGGYTVRLYCDGDTARIHFSGSGFGTNFAKSFASGATGTYSSSCYSDPQSIDVSCGGDDCQKLTHLCDRCPIGEFFCDQANDCIAITDCCDPIYGFKNNGDFWCGSTKTCNNGNVETSTTKCCVDGQRIVNEGDSCAPEIPGTICGGGQCRVCDQDGDGYKRKDIAACNGNDCNDEDINVWLEKNVILDNDKDGRAAVDPLTGAPASLDCVGEESGGYYEVKGKSYKENPTIGDCNDADASLYQELTGAIDSDGDGYTVGNDIPGICSGDSLPDGYIPPNEEEDDCDDDNINAWREIDGLMIDATKVDESTGVWDVVPGRDGQQDEVFTVEQPRADFLQTHPDLLREGHYKPDPDAAPTKRCVGLDNGGYYSSDGSSYIYTVYTPAQTPESSVTDDVIDAVSGFLDDIWTNFMEGATRPEQIPVRAIGLSTYYLTANVELEGGAIEEAIVSNTYAYGPHGFTFDEEVVINISVHPDLSKLGIVQIMPDSEIQLWKGETVDNDFDQLINDDCEDTLYDDIVYKIIDSAGGVIETPSGLAKLQIPMNAVSNPTVFYIGFNTLNPNIVDANGCSIYDFDQDGVLDDQDNCRFTTNLNQDNADGDELGDACDPCIDDSANDCPSAQGWEYTADGASAPLQNVVSRIDDWKQGSLGLLELIQLIKTYLG